MKFDDRLRKAVHIDTLILGDGDVTEQRVMMMPLRIPTSGLDGELCRKCISDGKFSDLQNDFLLGGFDFRDGEGELIVEMCCPGRTLAEKLLGKKALVYVGSL